MRKEVGTSIPVSGQFPSKFTLQVYTPPPDGALFACFHDDPTRPGKIGRADIAAIVQGADPSSLKTADQYGQVKGFMIAYVDADLPATSDCPVGPLSKGFHLFKEGPYVVPANCPPDSPPDDPACRDPWPYTEVPLSTELTLVLSHDDGGTTPAPPPAGAP